MGRTIDKIGIESHVMVPFFIMMDQIVEDGRMVRVDGVEAEDEGEGMHHIVLRIQDGKGVGLVADRTMKDIYLNVNGMVSPILGGDVRCVIIALKLLLSIWIASNNITRFVRMYL